jgi:hypothetical protein
LEAIVSVVVSLNPARQQPDVERLLIHFAHREILAAERRPDLSASHPAGVPAYLLARS